MSWKYFLTSQLSKPMPSPIKPQTLIPSKPSRTFKPSSAPILSTSIPSDPHIIWQQRSPSAAGLTCSFATTCRFLRTLNRSCTVLWDLTTSIERHSLPLRSAKSYAYLRKEALWDKKNNFARAQSEIAPLFSSFSSSLPFLFP